jgi:hypothetical protein
MYKILLAACIAVASLLFPACAQLPQAMQNQFPIKKENKWVESDKRFLDYLESRDLYTDETIHKHPYADLLSSAEVNDITWQERKYITDALDEFPKKWVLNNLDMVSGPRWLDDHHVAVSTRSYPGWVAEANEPPRIISINIDTLDITDLGYRGKLECLNHKGDLMISLDPEPAKGIRLRDGLNWYIGTWGQPLQKIKWEGSHFVPKYLCRYFPYGDLIHGGDWESLPIGAHQIFPLLPEHGVLKESITLKNNYPYYQLEILKTDGTAVIMNISKPVDDYFEYQPWDSSYFYTKVAKNPSVTIYPTGKYLIHHPPRLIKFWTEYRISEADAHGTKLGVLWVLASFSTKWRKHGLYLETKNGLLRVEEGQGGFKTVISPNGCRVLTFVERGDTTAKKRTGPMGYMLIDLCNTGAKQ